MKYIKKISCINQININDYDYVGFCPELNEYMLTIVVPWKSYYLRYYWISLEDYELAKNNPNEFKTKYKEAFDSVMELPKGITFMGSQALRDYEGRENFQLYISSGTTSTNVFQHFLYEDTVLYAHILMDGTHYAVLPYRIIKNESGEYTRPLEDNPHAEMFYANIDGEEQALFMGIKIDNFDGFEEWEFEE